MNDESVGQSFQRMEPVAGPPHTDRGKNSFYSNIRLKVNNLI